MISGHAATIFQARRVISMGEDDVRAFAVSGGRIVATGTPADLRERWPRAEVIDFGEEVVVPGFNDAHIHLAQTTDDLLTVDLSSPGTANLEQARSTLGQEAARTPAGEWILGSRYDDSKMAGGRVLNRWELDAVTVEHPVLVVHVAGHWAVANSAALALAGIDEATAPPPGGAFGRDAGGRLNGILYERALDVLSSPSTRDGASIIPRPGLDERLRALERATHQFHAAGLTSVGEAFAVREDVSLFLEGIRRGTLTLRVNALIAWTDYEGIDPAEISAQTDPLRLRIDGVKAFVDGAVGGRTCLLEEPFEGTTDDYGIQTMATADLRDLVMKVHGEGGRVAIHANGDRAISLLLDQFEAAQERAPRPDAHHRIEHCTIVNEDILGRMQRLGAIAVPFGSYVHYYGGSMLDWYGPRRVSRMFAHRSFLDMGIPVLGSSDYPCGPFEPLLALQSCVTRQGYDGAIVGETQRISPLEALSLYTTAPAEATGQGKEKGRLLPGYLADFVVLGGDPLTVEAERLGEIGVLETYVGGERVWAAPSEL